MDGAIDMHSHILPGADHGSGSVETSLAQLAAAESCGVAVVVATPHFYPSSSSSKHFFERRAQAESALKSAYHGSLKILRGAEVFLCEGLQNHPNLTDLCIENTSVMLVEMPPAPWSARLEEALDELDAAGIYVLLAHIERYPERDVNRLLSMGFHGQINAQSLLKGRWRKHALNLIDAGCITAIGSDVHGADRSYGEYGRAAELLGGRGQILDERMRELLNLLPLEKS